MPNRFAPIVVLAMIVGGCAPAPESRPPTAAADPTVTVEPSPTTGTPAALPSPAPSTSAPTRLAWMELAARGPAAREDHTWTVDGDGPTAYLFGGRDGATVFGDLWAYDLAADSWTELAVEAGPTPRFGHEAVWIDGIGLVIFAGQAGADFFNDLWAFDQAEGEWRELRAGGEMPVSRYGSCAAVGPDGRLWISHGFTSDGTRFSDTRAYDFGSGTWSDETSTDGGRPVERCLHGCWWTDADELVLYAGQTTGATALGDRWRYSHGAWTRAEGSLPPDRNLYARTRVNGATLVFGGQALDESYLADLWLLPDGEADAVPIEPDGAAPDGRAGGELIRDVAGQRVLLFGGRDGDGARADLWELRGDAVADR